LWLDGATGVGYGDGDDETVLEDMRGAYLTVYLRRRFDVPDPRALRTLVLEMGYDDGFVAYLNGVEVARSASMAETGVPPAFDRRAADSHEAGAGREYFNLNRYREFLVAGTNVLAVQVHNASPGSSDLSCLPRLLEREILPGSVENGDPAGVWAFRFDPEEHDPGEKRLFAGTAHELVIPGGRDGPEGVEDAIEAIDFMVGHPSTAAFVCTKLIQKFVSDELTLAAYRDGTAPAALLGLLDDAMAAWHATEPPGHVETVLRAILDPAGRESPFWSSAAYRSKVKTPVEFIHSSIRALGASASGDGLPGRNDAMGMHLFTREEPDGWSELGPDWVDTGSMLARIEFAQDLGGNAAAEFGWDPAALLEEREPEDAAAVVDFFDRILFQETLPAATKGLLAEYLSTDYEWNEVPLEPGTADFTRRVEELVALMLSMPHWNFQ
jgi:hypothetical protein